MMDSYLTTSMRSMRSGIFRQLLDAERYVGSRLSEC